ncbi:DUF928 domain-containing protein [Candidatus Venteria ishoeyi]|uniref:DUF928 domain-containing protein n=1 Tax=Candidatus Venteria ishoeyi TaxID=1899563 RepID=A0A1H6FGQ0_9GAMM|nr:DUF928 domain-containing protein [Candidatus Venteria ishoeyi]SEH07448.1 Uncharacterised protein [Candidatus Venteria ishoeyi]SEH08215.1 Uncharacterised protein [Candidatus Venteria ishoeyi]
MMNSLKISLAGLCASALYLTLASSPLNLGMTQTALAAPPAYKPPTVGSPSRRVGGGTRTKGTPPMITLLAPPTTAYTLQTQPVIYWAISESKYPIDIQLMEANPDSIEAMQPLLEKQISIDNAGIQKLDLKAMEVTLKPNVEYELFISAIMDPDNRGQDVISSAILKSVPKTGKVASCLQQADKQTVTYENLATCGIWYDAIAELSTQIHTQKDNAKLKAARRALMMQVKLPEVAELDK